MKLDLATLPVELIACIYTHSCLRSLVALSQTCRYFHDIASSDVLNPWRRPLARALEPGASPEDTECLRTLAIYGDLVPRQNWVWILSVTGPRPCSRNYVGLTRPCGYRSFAGDIGCSKTWSCQDCGIPSGERSASGAFCRATQTKILLRGVPSSFGQSVRIAELSVR
jgi:hypothetical protein